MTLVMALSGFAALGFQVVWTRQFGVWLGHEMIAVLAIVTAFFGGLAAGAWLAGRIVDKSAAPGRWYVALELIISFWALTLTLLLPTVGAWLVALVGETPSALRHWGIAFIGPFLLMLPATLAMGATLPTIERVFARARKDGYAIGGLYGANTLGAVGGVVLTTFVLAPRVGYSTTALVCVALNLLCAAIAFSAFRTKYSTPPRTQPPSPRHRSTAILWTLALTGFLGIGYEIAVIRVLSQVTDNTVFTFASLLAVYLTGTAIGGLAYQRWLSSYPDGERLAVWLLAAVAIACLTGVSLLGISETLRMGMLEVLGVGPANAVLIEATLALMVFAAPTLAMGALFTHLSVTAKESGWTFGAALSANTLGATLAGPIVGVMLLTSLGPRTTLIGLSLGYLIWLLPMPGNRKRHVGHAACVVLSAGAVMVFVPNLTFLTVPDGGRVLSHQDGVMAAVSVLEDARGVRTLHINNREQEGSSHSWLSDGRQAWLPLMLHPTPRTALFLGVGTGVTSLFASSHPELSVDAVELLPEVAATNQYFSQYLPVAFEADRRKLIVGDARRFVRASAKTYDVIVADLFHPARSGSGALYTVEHFAAIRSRLADGGLVCQWLPLHQMDLESLGSIVRAFQQVFPHATAILASNSLDTPVIGLIAHRDGGRFAPRSVADLSQAGDKAVLAALQLADEMAVVGSFFADADSLAAFASDAAPNTDDLPIVSHRAPALLYDPLDTPRSRLAFLVQHWSAQPATILAGQPSQDSLDHHARVTRYWEARDHFLLAGMQVRPDADLPGLLAQVEQPLLATLAISAEFRPAYDPLLNMALAMAAIDPEHSRNLLHRLAAAQPQRSEAIEALRRSSALGQLSNHPSTNE